MESHADAPLLTSKHVSNNVHFRNDIQDSPPITGAKEFFVQFGIESKKLWYLAGPAIFTSVCRYSLGAVTQTFAGHVGTLDLAAFSVENSVIAGFSLGIMLGMGSALETLCGQAYGAGHVDMLGVYMQRSWVILLVTAMMMLSLYIFATPLLLFIGQTEEIAHAAGKMALWMIPQLFAYALNYPIAKFLQAQSKIMVMAYIAATALVLHTLFSWLLMLKLGWGLLGGAVVLNLSWWFIVVAQLIYIFSGSCGRAWSGFSWAAFSNLWSFVKLSFASAIMLCLETWYFMALVLFAGYLKNAEVAVDALSICVRVSNELGAGHPRAAKFAIGVVVASSFAFGVAIGAGWQAVIAYINIACYYVFGIPLGLTLGFLADWGIKGIWIGMLTGTVVQTTVLFCICYRTNWDKE
ncbi:Multi antimicrobial extrusion protein, partial [Cynara cardunculus var. scolymus]